MQRRSHQSASTTTTSAPTTLSCMKQRAIVSSTPPCWRLDGPPPTPVQAPQYSAVPPTAPTHGLSTVEHCWSRDDPPSRVCGHSQVSFEDERSAALPTLPAVKAGRLNDSTWPGETQEKQQGFAHHRRRHYNMREALKRFVPHCVVHYSIMINNNNIIVNISCC